MTHQYSCVCRLAGRPVRQQQARLRDIICQRVELNSVSRRSSTLRPAKDQISVCVKCCRRCVRACGVLQQKHWPRACLCQSQQRRRTVCGQRNQIRFIVINRLFCGISDKNIFAASTPIDRSPSIARLKNCVSAKRRAGCRIRSDTNFPVSTIFDRVICRVSVADCGKRLIPR